jgi:hypothetical protein
MTRHLFAILGIGGLLASANTTLADTVTFKCSFTGGVPQQIVYVVNSVAQDVAVIGDFGTHNAHVLTYTDGFYYVLEPNNGASVATIIYLKAGETPVGVRTTLGLISQDQFQGIPEDLRLSSERLRFIAATAKGQCPIQR